VIDESLTLVNAKQTRFRGEPESVKEWFWLARVLFYGLAMKAVSEIPGSTSQGLLMLCLKEFLAAVPKYVPERKVTRVYF
jgi:hypothetical protein